MADFQRARSAEQKEQRMSQIRDAAAELYSEVPYHQITLATIAERLGWSRASLYKYVTTKEEVFLGLAERERTRYFQALLAAFPEGCGYAPEVAAEVWGGIANAHQVWFRLSSMLMNIVETNVTLERLVAFKSCYYEQLSDLEDHLAPELGIPAAMTERLLNDVGFHAAGLVNSCWDNPPVRAALEAIGRTPVDFDFRTEMRDFTALCLGRYRA